MLGFGPELVGLLVPEGTPDILVGPGVAGDEGAGVLLTGLLGPGALGVRDGAPGVEEPTGVLPAAISLSSVLLKVPVIPARVNLAEKPRTGKIGLSTCLRLKEVKRMKYWFEFCPTVASGVN